jgi:cyanophycinase
LLAAGCVAGASAQLASKTTHYDLFVLGNTTDVATKTRGGLQLEGGGTDQPDAFAWLVDHAGGGDIVVIRASGTDAYNPFIAKLGKTNSVTTIVFHDRDAASDPAIIERLQHAEAVFLAGGDQSNYVEYWKGTPVEDTLNALAKRGVPIGGTSAGLAVMGQFGFSAMSATHASITSPEALANPFSDKLTIERAFLSLPNMAGIITDSHYVVRDRLGRSLVFLARMQQEGWANPARLIAVDQESAVLVEADGSAKVVGKTNAYFMTTTHEPDVCQPNTPLTMHDIAVFRVAPGGTFNIKTWTGPDGLAYTLAVDKGVVTSSNGKLY